MTKETIKKFFDKLAPTWDDSLVIDNSKINLILDIAGVSQGCRVLDVACGTGVLFPFYEERRVGLLTGVDISPVMVKIALGKIKNENFRVVCDDIESMQPDILYDCCVIYNAFPHFPNPDSLIKKLSAWLCQGGRITIAHSMSIEDLNKHHEGSASEVSRQMLSADSLAELLASRFCVDTKISDEEKYVVSGVLRSCDVWE